MVSASADKTLVTWTFKSKQRKGKEHQVSEERQPEEVAKDEKEDEGKDREDDELGSDAHTTARGFHYKPARFYEAFPLKIVVDDTPECCGFAANN